MAHTCPHPLCRVNVNDRYLACRAHWAQVPRPLREAIYATVGDLDRRAYFGHVADAQAIWDEKARMKLAASEPAA